MVGSELTSHFALESTARALLQRELLLELDEFEAKGLGNGISLGFLGNAIKLFLLFPLLFFLLSLHVLIFVQNFLSTRLIRGCLHLDNRGRLLALRLRFGFCFWLEGLHVLARVKLDHFDAAVLPALADVEDCDELGEILSHLMNDLVYVGEEHVADVLPR